MNSTAIAAIELVDDAIAAIEPAFTTRSITVAMVETAIAKVSLFFHWKMTSSFVKELKLKNRPSCIGFKVCFRSSAANTL